MSIYVARNPYRSQFGAGSRVAGRIDRVARFRAQHKPENRSSLSVDRQHLKQKIRNKMLSFSFSPIFAIVGLMVLAGGLGVLYLAHFNMVATKGYDLKRLEANRQQLLSVYDVNNMKLAEMKSLARIMATDRISIMRPPAEITYVRPNTAVAMVNMN